MEQKMTKHNQIPVRFVEAIETPRPNYVWIIDTITGKALKVGLCDLHGARQMINFLTLQVREG